MSNFIKTICKSHCLLQVFYHIVSKPGVGEDSWESLGQQGDQSNQS